MGIDASTKRRSVYNSSDECVCDMYQLHQVLPQFLLTVSNINTFCFQVKASTSCQPGTTKTRIDDWPMEDGTSL